MIRKIKTSCDLLSAEYRTGRFDSNLDPSEKKVRMEKLMENLFPRPVQHHKNPCLAPWDSVLANCNMDYEESEDLLYYHGLKSQEGQWIPELLELSMIIIVTTTICKTGIEVPSLIHTDFVNSRGRHFFCEFFTIADYSIAS